MIALAYPRWASGTRCEEEEATAATVENSESASCRHNRREDSRLTRGAMRMGLDTSRFLVKLKETFFYFRQLWPQT
jgi:hypothetical protein